MKTLLILIPGLCATLSLHAQKVSEESVPQIVRSGLPKSYQAKNVAWSKEESNYEAAFKSEGKEISLVIDAAGKIIETETEIRKSAIPAAIAGTLQKDYAGYIIEEAARIVAANGEDSYEVEVEKGKETFELI